MKSFRPSQFGIITLVLVAALAASLLFSGCGSSSSSKEEYKEQVQACIDEYNEAYNTYTTRVIQELGSIDSAKALTEDEIAKIHEMDDEFVASADAALDKMAALEAPSEYKEVQDKIDEYVTAMKDIAVPAMVAPLDALKVGETLSHYSSADGKPSDQKAAVLKRANAEFVEALKTIGIDLDVEEHGSDEATAT